ncbi:MAG: transaldolase, partial [Ilumatobacteraceae bacterium]
RVDVDVDQAHAVWAQLGEVGVDVDDVAATLEHEGVSNFEKSFDELLAALGAKAEELRGS